MVLVTDPEPVCYAVDVSPPPPPGCVTEKIFADTGANRSIHPNGRSAVSFYRMSLDIATATAGKPMRSEGVGKMLLYSPDGNQFPGFENVVFAKNASEKLASVFVTLAWCVCLPSMAYALTKIHIFLYWGKVFTNDVRYKKTRLYPLTLYRKSCEKNMIDIVSLEKDFSSEEKNIEKKYFLSLSRAILLPSLVLDAVAAPT
jgi:hypothetical protein